MAAPTVTNTFAANTLIQSGQANTNFSDLVTYISNRNDATATWDRVSVSSSSAVPLIVNNSTGTSDIANFQDNGTNIFRIIDGGNVYMNATKKLYFDGGTDSYITESSGNKIRTVANDAVGFDVTDTFVAVPAANELYLDGGIDTYIVQVSADTIDIATAGVVALQITSGQILDYKLAAVALGAGGAATLGATGGSGPATTTQNSWVKVKIAGTDSYIPIWR